MCETCSSFFHEFSKNYHGEGREEKRKELLIQRLGRGGKQSCGGRGEERGGQLRRPVAVRAEVL